MSRSIAVRDDASPVRIAVVRVTPTSSDAAVVAVRRGLRTALPVASRRTGPPPGRWSASRISRGTSTGPTSSTPTKDTMPPASIAGTELPETARASRTPPPRRQTAASPRRQRPAAERTSTPVSGRSAASGATRVAVRVGSQAAPSVTRVPTANADRAQTGSRAAGPMSVNHRRTRATRPAPAATPTTIPTAAAARPSASASSRIARRSCRRVTPTQRSSAKSRIRWAKRIEKVLVMTSTPTKRAIATKSRARSAMTSTPREISAWRAAVQSAADSTPASGAVARARSSEPPHATASTQRVSWKRRRSSHGT